MNLTLFIDESGDFQTHRGEWVISALLCSDKSVAAERILSNVCCPLVDKLNLKSKADFHLTELRKLHGVDVALEYASFLFRKIFSSKLPCRLVSVINQAKKNLSVRESTYRLMLLDLIALAESGLPEPHSIDSLELIIAKRTIEGVVQTSASNISELTITNFKIGIEEGLVSKGLIDLVNKNRITIKMEYASQSWGLIVSDFISNILYNRSNQNDNAIISQLKKDNHLDVFNAFGDYEKRRARIAYRDKHYITAIARWSEIVSRQGNKSAEDSDELNEIIRDLIRKRRVKLFEATIEGVIERIWRNYSESKDYDKIVSVLESLKMNIQHIISSEKVTSKYEFIIFRLNNMLLQSLNHIGESDQANDIVKEQHGIRYRISGDPNYLKMVMDFYLLEIDCDFNNLNLTDCLIKSNQYQKLVENYLELAEMITESETSDIKIRSREYLRSKMNFIKYILFSHYLLDEESYQKILSEIEQLNKLSIGFNELHRLLGLKILCTIKARKTDRISDIWHEYDKKYLNEFDMYFLLRAINDNHFNCKDNRSINCEDIISTIDEIPIDGKSGHPFELIFREKALLYYFKDDVKKAMNCIKKAERILDEFSSESDIIKFQKIILNTHKSFITGGKLREEEFREIVRKFKLLSIYNENSKNISPFFKLRVLSPL